MAAFRQEAEAFGYGIIQKYIDEYIDSDEKISTKKFIESAYQHPKAPGAFNKIVRNIHRHGLINDRYGKVILKTIKGELMRRRIITLEEHPLTQPDMETVVNDYELPDQYIGQALAGLANAQKTNLLVVHHFVEQLFVIFIYDKKYNDESLTFNEYFIMAKTRVYKAFNDLRLLLFLKEAQSWNDPMEHLMLDHDPSNPSSDEGETDWEMDSENGDFFDIDQSSDDEDVIQPME